MWWFTVESDIEQIPNKTSHPAVKKIDVGWFLLGHKNYT
jgi:hypothetical protein